MGMLIVTMERGRVAGLRLWLWRVRRSFRWSDDLFGTMLPGRWWAYWLLQARLAVVWRLDRDPRRCRAEMVMWAYGLTEWEAVSSDCVGCREDAARNGRCWCGKIEVPAMREWPR